MQEENNCQIRIRKTSQRGKTYFCTTIAIANLASLKKFIGGSYDVTKLNAQNTFIIEYNK